ncbi:MAG: glycoside hydrolase family 127 protein, partial [Dactylosporangium sp.]|nr:glycoside hydrolase family 127 protein [Dactylosporangium sp.]NNJ61278.1 glycoside hydrolase family 127 protein [Dactylosporangium sp.]
GYAATTDPDGVYIHLYGSGSLRADVDGHPVTLAVRTGYPWQGRIAVTVTDTAVERPWTLALRVPGWCEDVTVTVDGAPAPAHAERGYLRLRRLWPAGASVVVDLGMPPRLGTAHPRVDAVRGCVAVLRGPLVFCLEEADLPAGVTLEDVRLDASAPIRVVEPEPGAGIPVLLAATGQVVDGSADDLYPALGPGAPAGAFLDAGPAGRSGIALSLVPYFLWGNRAPGSMRVWIPVGTT